jgi:hypothetical protein
VSVSWQPFRKSPAHALIGGEEVPGMTTTITINGKTVTRGEKVRTERGDVFTFDYERDGLIYVVERSNGFYPSAIADKAE